MLPRTRQSGRGRVDGDLAATPGRAQECRLPRCFAVCAPKKCGFGAAGKDQAPGAGPAVEGDVVDKGRIKVVRVKKK